MSEEVEYTSWGSRLMSSIKGVLVGIVLFLGSFVLLFWNEGRAVRTEKDLAEGRATCVEATADKVEPANNGKLVHVTGKAVTAEVLKDPRFAVQANALRLQRTAKMYQWIEKKETKTEKQLGGSEKTTTTYTYTKDWDEAWHDSSAFHDKQTPPNPAMTIQTDGWTAGQVKIGAFALPAGMVELLHAWEPLAATQGAALGAEAPAPTPTPQPQVVGPELYVGADASNPRIGDVKISYKVVRPGEVSLLARQNGSTFEHSVGSSGTDLTQLKPGVLSADAMFQQARAENATLTWILRLVGLVAMAIGIGLVFAPLATLGDVVPFIGSILGAGIGIFAVLVSVPLTLVTIGLAWVAYRPMVGIPLLLAGVGAFILALRLKKKKPAAA